MCAFVSCSRNERPAIIGTQRLLDLFELSPVTDPSTSAARAVANADDGTEAERLAEAVADRTHESGSGGLRGVLDGLGELWGAEQYEEEFDLQSFLATL